MAANLFQTRSTDWPVEDGNVRPSAVSLSFFSTVEEGWRVWDGEMAMLLLILGIRWWGHITTLLEVRPSALALSRITL